MYITNKKEDMIKDKQKDKNSWEFISTGRASKESDVFSFGGVALEIATGRKAIDPLKQGSETSLVHWIWHLYETREHLLAVDKRLNTEFDRDQAECLMIVGLELPSKMPTPVYVPTSSVSSSEPSITNQAFNSVAEQLHI
ncbi:hypothetical protein V6N12_076266 [Hibiscus sabdariffa]|uniref:Serine-threonine/tyrosine-protein kinase catalytic domain-containing protein n=1 Tax=Hibiscus sabdariffa TaxID=183260 RepID=A0ABR2AC15_9ROSI